MSRGGRGRGRGGARGGGPNVLPIGVSYADLPRAQTELYPPYSDMPSMTACTDFEKKACKLLVGYIDRLKRSPYYIVETITVDDVPRYSDKYRKMSSRPALSKDVLSKDLHPKEIYAAYFNLKNKKKVRKKKQTKTGELGGIGEEDTEDREASGSDSGSAKGSQIDVEDYDVDEEEDNDYAMNYFDNGEGDDEDDLGDGMRGDDGGGDWE